MYLWRRERQRSCKQRPQPGTQGTRGDGQKRMLKGLRGWRGAPTTTSGLTAVWGEGSWGEAQGYPIFLGSFCDGEMTFTANLKVWGSSSAGESSDAAPGLQVIL